MSTRRIRLNVSMLAVVAFVTIGITLAQPPPVAEGAMTAAEQEVLDLINEERARNGLGPLVATQTLDAAAAWLAADLATIDALDHTDTLGRGLRERLNAFDYPGNSTIRENIAAGYSTPASVVQGWINSPGHYANILAPEATAAGIALYEAPGTKFRFFWAMDFGSVIDTAPPSGAGATSPTVTPTPAPTATPAPQPQAKPVAISGPVPSRGVGLIVVQEPAAAEQLIASVEANGCEQASVWITSNGQFIGFVAGAPAFVNQGFPASIPAGSPFIVVCG